MENRFLDQAYKANHSIWNYVLGIILVVIGALTFSLPYNLVIANKITEGTADASRVEDINYLYTLLDSNTSLFYMMLPFVGAMITLFIIIKKIHKQSWTSLTTSRVKIDYKRVFFSFFFWASITLLLFFIGYIISPEQVVWNFDAKKFSILFLLSIVLIPIQTSLEEYVFRGYLMQGLGVSSKTKWVPLLVTSVVFGLLHYANPEVKELGYGIMVFYIGTGLLLGIMTLMDEGIELSLGFHAANNLITALLVTADWTAFQTAAIFKDISSPSLMTELVAMFFLYPLLLFVYAKKYKWNAWKEKLI
ncbi:type II CAAX endopeptidase family protein [Wenyingzhuangia sp. chi5]|uniref:Type II CAAX endopeptidase family protein n=1 Tax=Wenyingzhuangia gilva TaxID=3057677 RepID=A0ABT8VN04_9FLAO|nr:type II CAAX endopeptidase family protein [Wenyingzhuangia sp. chi5]MDO3693350.1 type II CAAX endopeptidase family protein [Wenyingzhuangia sp. chi5]